MVVASNHLVRYLITYEEWDHARGLLLERAEVEAAVRATVGLAFWTGCREIVLGVQVNCSHF